MDYSFEEISTKAFIDHFGMETKNKIDKIIDQAFKVHNHVHIINSSFLSKVVESSPNNQHMISDLLGGYLTVKAKESMGTSNQEFMNLLNSKNELESFSTILGSFKSFDINLLPKDAQAFSIYLSLFNFISRHSSETPFIMKESYYQSQKKEIVKIIKQSIKKLDDQLEFLTTTISVPPGKEQDFFESFPNTFTIILTDTDLKVVENGETKEIGIHHG